MSLGGQRWLRTGGGRFGACLLPVVSGPVCSGKEAVRFLNGLL